MRRALGIWFLPLASACSFSESTPRYHTGLEGLEIVSVNPGTVLPGSVISVEGRSFIDQPWGQSELRLAGTFDARSVDVRVPVRFVDFEHVELQVSEEMLGQLGARAGDFTGTAQVAVESSVDGEVHTTSELEVALAFRTELTPRLDPVQDGSIIYVNDELTVTGADMLLGGDEGTTYAEVKGCFARAGAGDCEEVGPVSVPVVPASRFDRSRGTFRFVPEIAGIRAGSFEGQIRLRNLHGRGAVLASEPATAGYQVTEAEVTGVTPSEASLGQFVLVEGGGFVGGAPDQVTLLHLVGSYQPDGGGLATAIDTFLVPEFVAGRVVRYVLNEDDDLGQALDLRGGSGELSGTVTPIVSFRDDEVTGAARSFAGVRMAPVKQVVYLRFTTQYVTSLQHFGLRAAEPAIRERILEVVRRDYRTVNVEIRTERPDDFSLYSEVEIGGPDPNGLGLIGYDNTPGKDVGNLRLHDRIGGVNATTQADGFPGYGGVFVDSMFLFSEHPAGFAPDSPGQDAMFDEIFDPFRPDRDGEPIGDGDPAPRALASGDGCPADGRGEQIDCAVWVLGSLIGTTISHELGHSLGLANPGGSDVHIVTDKPGRLMEGGGTRSFRERAELDGEGPGQFCDQEYVYLRAILASDQPDDPATRPDCL
ncbi:MAG TPA: hypothetical protein VFU21_08725 [Kofleriaceae bacterium]|nr:hypothetical protein [Kofleriaceae bacterium]